MIERGEAAGGSWVAPWSGRDPLACLAFAAIQASGPDAGQDGVFRMQALRRDALGAGFESFDRLCRPFAGRPVDAAVERRLREQGVELADLEGAGSPEDAYADLRPFLGEGVVIVPEREAFVGWCRRLGAQPPALVLGLDQLDALLALPRARTRGPRTLAPDATARELAESVGRFLGLDRPGLRMVAASWLASWRALATHDDETAEVLRVALALLDRPSRWLGAAGPAYAPPPALADGLVAQALAGLDPETAADAARELAEELRPRCAVLADELELEPTVPVHSETPAPLSESDLALVDDVFAVHLPALLAGDDGPMRYREGQHQVAREVARTLGRHELLLVHAPTGTGKTLAYLVPALLWSVRHDRRAGVSTFTRALQEQAMQREVPRAIEALERAGFRPRPRVALLKGRANYLCWRALRAHAPGPEDGAGAWLAWSALAAFAATDPEGDLDRMPVAIGLCAGPRPQYQRELETLMRAVRAQTACCTERGDRATCAAEIARMRAERSHVVITNHAFALARQDFFKTVIFDECEHLHEQAHGAWSHALSLAALGELLERLGSGAGPSQRGPFDRLARLVLSGSRAEGVLREALFARAQALAAVAELEREVAGFKDWRRRLEGERAERERYALLGEWVERGLAAGLIAAHGAALAALSALDASVADVLEHLATVPMRNPRRLRRSLERARTDLADVYASLSAWLPKKDGVVAFAEETFYDVEEDPRSGDVLSARVLLPNEYLGRHYYPQLAGGVFLSATTFLRGGFESASGYLGLDRAAEPLPSEEREPSVVRMFRAGDPFEWSRVRVLVPDDAPGYASERGRFQEYVRRFVAFLAERTRGRMLVLFTNAEELKRTAEGLEDFFRERKIPFWWQGMRGASKESLGDLFRARVDSVLFGVDTFWYGADFAGETLEHLVIVKLPWGVPDRYHHAQCAALGQSEQRRRIYLPRALAKFRQGFGRLMRREGDRGCVFVLDNRVLRGQNRLFLLELPLANGLDGMEDREWRAGGARLIVGATERCVREALAHVELLDDVRRRGLDVPFGPEFVAERPAYEPEAEGLESAPRRPRRRSRARPPEIPEFPADDLPF